MNDCLFPKNNLSFEKTNYELKAEIDEIYNERKALELESQLFKMQKERDQINGQFLKFAEFPRKREEINAKRKIEIRLNEMNKDIDLLKLKIREMKKI